MSTIKSQDENLTLNAHGSGNDIKFQSNGVEKASISDAGLFTSTTIDATKLTGTIPNFTSTGIDDNADATAITIDSSERVGIGTGVPAHNLDISPASGDAELKISGAEGQSASIRLFADQGDDAADIKRLLTDTSGNFKIQHYVGSAYVDSMVIDSSGNVGIGATNPSTPLYITKSTNDITGAKLTLNNPHTGNGDYGSTIAFHAGTGGSGTTDTNIGNITCYKKDNTNGSKMRFQIQKGNFSGIDTVLTIDDDGRMHGGSYTFETGHLNLIGETGQNYKAMTFSRTAGGGVVGHITTNSSTTTYATSSDYRLKENVDYTWDATTRLKQLNPARFNWIKDDTNTLVDGFLAHEVSSIVPEAITGEKDAMKDEQYIITPAVEEVRDEEGNITTEAVEAVMGTRSVPDYQGIDQSKLVPLLVKTIQELEARITALES